LKWKIIPGSGNISHSRPFLQILNATVSFMPLTDARIAKERGKETGL
jgi:hypothetical protein